MRRHPKADGVPVGGSPGSDRVRPKGDTISGSRYRISGITNGAVWVWVPLSFRTRCTPQQSSLRSSVSRPSGNADIDAPRVRYLLSPLRACPWNRNIGIEAAAAMPAGDRCQGAGQGSQRSRRQGLRQHRRPGSGPKPFLAEQGKGNAEIALLWFFIVGPMLAVAGAVPFAWGWGLSWLDVAIGAVFYTLAGLGVTGGFHRLFTHRSYKAKRWLENTLATAACLSLEMSPIGWVAEHRRHHLFSDQVDELNETLDPHSPWRFGTTKRALAKGFLHSHMGWLFKRERTNPDRFAKDMVNDPAMQWLNKHYVYIVALTFIAPAI